mgnify:CR=1 FL=1
MKEMKIRVDERLYLHFLAVAEDCRVSVEEVARVALAVAPFNEDFTAILGADDVPPTWKLDEEAIWRDPKPGQRVPVRMNPGKVVVSLNGRSVDL